MPSALIFLILGGSNVAVFALETVAASRGGSLGAQAASVSDAEISADRVFVVISFPYVKSDTSSRLDLALAFGKRWLLKSLTIRQIAGWKESWLSQKRGVIICHIFGGRYVYGNLLRGTKHKCDRWYIHTLHHANRVIKLAQIYS